MAKQNGNGDLTLRSVLVGMANYLESRVIEYLEEERYFDMHDMQQETLVGDLVGWVKDELERLEDSPEDTGWVRGFADSPLREGFHALQTVVAMDRGDQRGRKPRRSGSGRRGGRSRGKDSGGGSGQKQKTLPGSQTHPDEEHHDFNYYDCVDDTTYLSEEDISYLAHQAAEDEARQARDHLSHNPSRDYGDYIRDHFNQFPDKF